ncbi:hypothetical protein QUB33_19580 [Microcoleus sp. B3-A4]|uniref:hypothetical protein n=1 Tax=Microcoleus sp. B3-A4 TaxID=2818653 RepID=UPI002FD795D3
MFNVEAMRLFFSPQRIVGILASRILPVFAALGMIVLRHRWREFLPLLLVSGYDSFAHLCRSSLERAAASDFCGGNCYGCGGTSASVEVN